MTEMRTPHKCMSSTTPFADRFVGRGEEVIKAELRRLRLLEADCLQRQEQAQIKLDEEKRKQALQVKERLAEVELMEKSISYFQFKTTLSSFIDARMLREAEASHTCFQVLDAFLRFQQSPAHLTELLGDDDDDGHLSSLLLDLCHIISNTNALKSKYREDMHQTAQQLELWIDTRLKLRMTQFEIARRSQHIPLMQAHANYLCRHEKGELFCSFLADLGLRPLLSQHQPCVNVQMLHFVFDQTKAQLQQLKQQVFGNLNLEAHLAKFENKLFTTLFPPGKHAGLQVLLTTWFPTDSAVLKLDLLVACKERVVRLVKEDISAKFSLLPLDRLFPAKDYYMLEISHLTSNALSQDALENETDLGKFITNEAQPFVDEMFARLQEATLRGKSYLSTSEFQTSCFETFCSFASMRIINQLCMPLLHKYASLMDEEEEEGVEEHERVFCNTVVPFVETFCCARLLDFFSSQINSKLLVEGKVALVHRELEQIFQSRVDLMFGEMDFREAVKAFPGRAKRLEVFGDGVLVNFFLRFKSQVFEECLQKRQVITSERGEALAIELAQIGTMVDENLLVFKTPLAVKRGKRIVQEIKQLGNVFALPKGALQLDTLELICHSTSVQNFVQGRKY